MRDSRTHTEDTERGIVLELRPKGKDFDFSEIAADIANGRPVDLSHCDVRYHVSMVDSFAPEFVAYIVQHGLTSFLRRRPLMEALVARGTSEADVQALLQAFMAALSPMTDLVIVDPYFFARSDTGYPQLVERVLQPVLPGLRNLTVVTLPNNVSAVTLSDVTNLLTSSAPHLSIVHKTSNAFHDRFWIDPVSGKGFITGTSLNGLGRKYSLVDHLQSPDAADVLAALRSEGLLNI